MNELIRAAAHVRHHRDSIIVLKIGGSCLQKPRARRALVQQIATVQALGARLVVVHGGGPQTDANQRSLGEVPRMVDGRRVTTPLALRALRMSVSELNGELSAALDEAGAPATAVCAADAGIVVATRRPPIETSEGLVDFGAVGDVQSVDPAPLRGLIERGLTPVVCPPVAGAGESFLNLNADTLAATLAVALGAAKLVLVTDAAGILSDPKDPQSVLSVLEPGRLRELHASGALLQGMSVKATAIELALAGGVARVHVVSGQDPEALLVELYTSHGSGTLITHEGELAPKELSPEEDAQTGEGRESEEDQGAQHITG